MLVDRHHTQYLIELGELAREASATVLAERKDVVEMFLGTLGGAASPAAILAFEARMQGAERGPWSAVTLGAASGPPAAVLVRGQLDDDPDGEEDGNRIPGTAEWAQLRDALERWDTPVILAWVGPLGWQSPMVPPQYDQDPEISMGPVVPPSSPRHAASLAAQEADARSQKALRTIGTVAAVGGAGGLLFGLGRAIGRVATNSRIDIAKEPTS